MELLPYDTALGQDASGDKKPAASTSGGQLLPYEEATGAVQPTSVKGFLTNPRSYRDMAGYAAGVGAQLSDMFTGLGKSLLGGTAYLVDRAGSKGSMVAPAPRTADAPPVTAAERANVREFARQDSARRAQVTKDMFPEELATPWKKVAEAMGPEAVNAYENNGVGWVMGKIGEVIEKGGKAAEGASGLPASDFINAVDLFTGILGARALKPQAQAMLKTRLGQMRSEMKAANKARPLTAEEMAAAYTGTERFRGGQGAPAKATDFQATQEMPAFDATQPMPGFEETQPIRRRGGLATPPPAEGARPLADVLDPYKIPAIAAGTAAGVWAMQNQLDDEQLAALGLAGAAAIVRLDGVPEPRLVDMLKQGGATREAAAAQIYRDNVPMLTRSLRKYEKQGVQIEDVVQRTMEKGLRAIEKGQFSGDSAIATYLFRIADNEAKSGMRYEKVRPQTESMDLDETPGAGKGDESKPSPHENIADESLAGRSPEQVALNNALGAKMAAALDGLPENFRRPFEMRELEGMEYAEIAEALGQPIGTVRSQISRAKEALQQKLREYRPEIGKVALVTGGAALAANQLDAEELAAVGLAGAGAMGAVKGKGGSWTPFAANALGNRLKGALGGRIVEGLTPPDVAAKVKPANDWADRAIGNYLNRYMGTESDPLKDFQLPSGARWEDLTDAIIESRGNNEWHIGKGEGYPAEAAIRAQSELKNYLSHVGDYLKANVDPAKLPQYDLVRAVKETKAWDDRMAKEAEKAAAREGNVALKRMESMQTVMNFPETGMRLVKLDKPGDFAHESTMMGHSVRGYEPHKAVTPDELRRDTMGEFDDPTPEEMARGVPAHPDWIPDSEKGMTEARFSSGHPSYGLGGWDAIKSGEAEVLSLRDSKGGSHVTIEIEKAPSVSAAERARAFKEDVLNYPQDRILQIKGKGNGPIPQKYQKQIADFLNSRQWDEVADIENTGIHKVYDTYLTGDEVRPLLKRTMERLAKQDRVDAESLKGQLKAIDNMDARQFLWAVNRQIQNIEHTLMMERVAAKRGGYAADAGKVALVAGATALAMEHLDADEVAALGLSGAGAMGAIKGKGGMWHPEAVKSLQQGFRIDLVGPGPADMAISKAWTERAVSNYLNKHAGTATDPLKDLELADGSTWGDVFDQAFTVAPSHAWKWKAYTDKPPNATEPVAGLRQDAPESEWGGDRFTSAVSLSRLQAHLRHVSDYITMHVADDKLAQYDFVRAVKETKAWDERMAKEAAKAEAREANVALKRMESMTVVQDFPGTGMKLVKLDKPGDFAHESTVMGHSVRGYEPHKGSYDSLGPLDDGHPDWVPESEKGMDNARFNSGDPNYGLGGWDAIKRGDAEILSLRDAKGGSHVTVEIRPAAPQSGGQVAFPDTSSVLQIRGKGNAPVPERYQQQIADFLNSREWGSVGDLDNAGIVKIGDRYHTASEVTAWITPIREAFETLDIAKRLAAAARKDDWTEYDVLRRQEIRIQNPRTGRADVFDINEVAGILSDPAAWNLAENPGLVPQMLNAVNQLLEAEGRPPIDPAVKRGVPPGQRGSASPEMMFTLAAATAGATLGAFLDEESPLKAGIYGALTTGLLASSKGRSILKQAIKSPDTFLGLVSTRLGKIAPELKGRLRLHELRILKAVDTVYDQVTPFLDALRNQPKAVQELVARELMNGKTAALNAIPELAAAYPKVRATLANVEGQLQSLGRFAEGVGNYFPRIVKDYEGLKNALGKLDPSLAQGLEAALVEANAKMMRKEQRGLTEVEQSVITNRYLFQTAPGSTLPGYAKARQIREVTEKIQPFYEAPAESLLRYLSGAITDIEAARFFGRDIKVGKSGKKKFTNVDESIGNLTARLLEEGKINSKQAMEIRDILRARFVGGEQSMNAGLGAVRNITNTALLGQFASAATQIGDSLASVYHFGLVPTLQGVVQKVIGSSKVTPKDLGLVNHLAEELSNKGVTGNVLHKALKYTGFQAIDLFAKQVNINAALNKYTSMAKTAKGRVQLAEKYGYAFEGEMPQLIADLQSGVLSPRTQRLAFEALSDVQPISRAELPQAYLEHPNGRLLYQLKTYMLKQADIVRRDAYDNIATRDPRKIMTGLKNLAGLATLYAFSSVPGDAIKDWLSGREIDVLSTPQLVENVTKTFGLNRYSADKLGQGKVVETGIGIMTPPLKVIEDILAGREKAVSYLPGIGRPLYDRAFDGNVKREIAEKKAANKGKPPGETELLSDEAKEYLDRKRKERKEKAEAGQ